MDVHKKENIEKTFNNTLIGIFDSLTKDSFEIKIEKAEVIEFETELKQTV